MKTITTAMKDVVRTNPFAVLILGEVAYGTRTFTDAEFVAYVADRREVGRNAPDVAESRNDAIRFLAGDAFNATPLESESLHEMVDEFMARIAAAPEMAEASKDQGYHDHMAGIKAHIENI